MRVIVLGGGVVGVASAWYLARAGHEVTVLDRRPAPGMETSFANAGQVSPGHSAPWAGPGIPVKALKWLMMRHRPWCSGRGWTRDSETCARMGLRRRGAV